MLLFLFLFSVLTQEHIFATSCLTFQWIDIYGWNEQKKTQNKTFFVHFFSLVWHAIIIISTRKLQHVYRPISNQRQMQAFKFMSCKIPTKNCLFFIESRFLDRFGEIGVYNVFVHGRVSYICFWCWCFLCVEMIASSSR